MGLQGLGKRTLSDSTMGVGEAIHCSLTMVSRPVRVEIKKIVDKALE
jgi:hypothetical protein